MTDIDLFSLFAVGGGTALGGVTLARYGYGFGIPMPWIFGPIVSGILTGSIIYLRVTSAVGPSLLIAGLVGALVSVPIAWWRLKDGLPDRW